MTQPAKPRSFRDAPWYTKLITLVLATALIAGGLGLIVWLLGIVWTAAIGVWS